MKFIEARSLRFATVLLLGGCAAQPLRPGVAVMPAPNKPFEVFQNDQAVCQHYAENQVGGSEAANAANNQAASGVVWGTLLGAGAGALLGWSGEGAATGAAVDLLAGAVVGGNNANRTAQQVQWQYDTAYQQCMYSHGNQVPGYQSANVPLPPPPPSAGQ